MVKTFFHLGLLLLPQFSFLVSDSDYYKAVSIKHYNNDRKKIVTVRKIMRIN